MYYFDGKTCITALGRLTKRSGAMLAPFLEGKTLVYLMLLIQSYSTTVYSFGSAWLGYGASIAPLRLKIIVAARGFGIVLFWRGNMYNGIRKNHKRSGAMLAPFWMGKIYKRILTNY